MHGSQTVITREVKRFMKRNKMTQADLAAPLCISQSQLSARINGRARWQLDDLDILLVLGVPIQLGAFMEAGKK